MYIYSFLLCKYLWNLNIWKNLTVFNSAGSVLWALYMKFIPWHLSNLHFYFHGSISLLICIWSGRTSDHSYNICMRTALAHLFCNLVLFLLFSHLLYETMKECEVVKNLVLHMCLLDRSHSDAHKLDHRYWKTKAEVTRRTSYMVHATHV